MVKTFVVEVIEVLQPKELEECQYFLESPYFNRGPNSEVLVNLFCFLTKSVQQKEFENLEKQALFEELFPGKPWIETKIDKLFTELKGLIIDFLNVNRYLSRQNETLRLLDATKEMRLRGLESRYQLSLEKLKKNAKAATWESTEDQFFLYQIALEEHEWHSIYNKSKGDLNIPDVVQHLENYFYAQKTELLNRLLLQGRATILTPSAQKVVNGPWAVPEEALTNSVLTALTWEIYLLLRKDNPKVDDFYHLLEVLKKREIEFNPTTLAQFNTYLRNICITFVNAGLVEFYQVLHDLHKDNLKRGYFYFEGKIPPAAYLNITLIALSVKEFDWAHHFIESHKDLLIGENDTRDFYHLNKANCLFAEKKYEEALEFISFGSSYSFYHLTARRLELKIYYELDSDLLPYKIDAFKMFISRAGSKVLSESMYELFVNFINFLRQLSLTPKIFDKSRSAQLIKRINEKKLVADRTWLLEKAAEIGQRKK